MTLDVRTYLILIVLTATCGSLNTNLCIELAIFFAIILLELLSGKDARTPRLALLYIILVVIQYALFPIIPSWISAALSLVVVNMRCFLPVFICIVMLYKKVRVSQMTATFTKMKFPKSFTVTLAVAIRYIPTVLGEWQHISDAMKVRNVCGSVRNPLKIIFLKAECFFAPFFTVTLKTADELSAAAVTRGIDNPNTPTCRNYRPMKAIDYIVIALSIATTSVCAILRYGGIN